MQTIHLTHTDPNAQPAITLMRRAFPGYSGRTFRVQVTDYPVDVRSSWEGGSRDYYAFVRLDGSAVTPEVPAQSGFDRPIRGAEAVTLPDGIACVRHAIFCGKDMGLTLIIGPSNAPALLPPAADDLPELHAYVLIATASLKNSYGGKSDIRFQAVRRAFEGDLPWFQPLVANPRAVTRADWDQACTELQARGFLNAQRAITPNGRNAVANHPHRNRLH